MDLYMQTDLHDAERRGDVAPILALVRSIHEDVSAMRQELNAHMHQEPLQLAQALDTLILAAFPSGDTKGHRDYHQAKIEAAKNQAEFWRKLSFELSKWGLLGFCGWLIADFFKNHFK